MVHVTDDARSTLLYALADDELILGHRHSEWTGWAPHIEEDVAFSSIAQDEMAHARLLYELASSLSGADDADVLAPAMGEAMAIFEPLPGEEELMAQGVLRRSNEDLLAEWLGQIGEAF